jgi:hypothetical protein
MNARNLPASWSSTANSLEKLAFIAKDAVLTIDDFAPGGSQWDIQRFHREADRILRAQGNLSGRQRMRPDGSLRPAKPPRGLILTTGEDVPKGQSVRARMLILELGQNDMDWKRLTDCQENAANGLYAQTLAGYIQWLVPRFEELRLNTPREIVNMRQCVTRSGQHRRTPEIVAELALGMQYFLEFADGVSAITIQEASELWDTCCQSLVKVAEQQSAHQGAGDPVKRFLELLSSALSSGHGHVAGPDGGQPDNPNAWGWRARTAGVDNMGRDWLPCGDRIGWVDGENLFLEPDASFRVAQQMAVYGAEGISVLPRTLHKRMKERGLLASRENGRLTCRQALDGSRKRVLHIHVSSLISHEVDRLGQLAGLATQKANNGDFGPVFGTSSPALAAGTGPQSGPENAFQTVGDTDCGQVGPLGPVSD